MVGDADAELLGDEVACPYLDLVVDMAKARPFSLDRSLDEFANVVPYGMAPPDEPKGKGKKGKG